MKGVVLAGGLGTRLRPSTNIINKHLLQVYDRPMIDYPIGTLVKAGIKDILLVTGGNHPDGFMQHLKNGKGLGVSSLYYAYQEGEGGIADALALAEDFANGEAITVILGDNCTDADISKEVAVFKEGAMVFLKEVPDPERFGVPVFKEDQLIAIEEKPLVPLSRYAVVGLYVYDETVFDRIRTLRPSLRGELEVTDLNNSYLREGKLHWGELQGFWKDAGTPESLFEVATYRREISMIIGRGKERR